MKYDSCPELYTCHRVKMTPLIRVLMRCTAAEAMESICATCEQESNRCEQDNDYVAASGQKITIVVGDEAEEMAGSALSSS